MSDLRTNYIQHVINKHGNDFCDLHLMESQSKITKAKFRSVWTGISDRFKSACASYYSNKDINVFNDEVFLYIVTIQFLNGQISLDYAKYLSNDAVKKLDAARSLLAFSSPGGYLVAHKSINYPHSKRPRAI